MPLIDVPHLFGFLPELDNAGMLSKIRNAGGRLSGGRPFSRGALYALLRNPIYIGKVSHRGQLHDG